MGGLPQWRNHSFSQPPALWMGIIMFCPKHLRFSCPDLPPKWVQLMTITLQVSQHRHVLIGTYLGGARACPPSKYVMITAVTQWGGGGHNCYQRNLFVFASAQLHINQSRQTRMDRLGCSPWDRKGSRLEVLEFRFGWRWRWMWSRSCFLHQTSFVRTGAFQF